ncbi:FecR domain-containing protein [Sphingomonas sp. CARO-RG-8B-R24-01]|uniref:FecR family protein n=1 Tax=Sphingomonas sp. CARO-RG-8B-R24-01 TaxID=2914831 RepID=UPI001F58B1AA|nr:FecR domain-containing protein [Sphingomonas sp. CARO-RG-8B-R24-01]
MNEDIGQRAAQWHAAQDADDMDWDGFAAWLEVDSRHRDAFDRIALLDDDIISQRSAILAGIDPPKEVPARAAGRRAGWRWVVAGGGAVAATLAVTAMIPRAAPDVAWRSDASSREIVLGDGSRVALAPHSRLVARNGDQTQLALTGAGYFEVPHRTGRSLSIAAGGYRISDIGTRFNVATDQAATRIAVADGDLTVTSLQLTAPITLVRGHAMVARGATVSVSTVAADSIGSWRRGQLLYAGAPLLLVANDISRYAGLETTVDPAIADLHFSGALKIGDGAKPAESLAAIVGVAARRDGVRTRLEPRR